MLTIKLTFLVLDMPKRPPWKYSMSKEQVERSEREMFDNFLDRIYDEYKLSELSYFERNLEVKICVMQHVSSHDQLNKSFEADRLDSKGNYIYKYSLIGGKNLSNATCKFPCPTK